MPLINSSHERRQLILRVLAARTQLTRQKIPDIPEHKRYHPTDEGSAQFAGMRQVDGEMLALLKRGEQIIVLPTDLATARRLKKLSVGEVVTLTRKGTIVTKGRKR